MYMSTQTSEWLYIYTFRHLICSLCVCFILPLVQLLIFKEVNFLLYAPLEDIRKYNNTWLSNPLKWRDSSEIRSIFFCYSFFLLETESVLTGQCFLCISWFEICFKIKTKIRNYQDIPLGLCSVNCCFLHNSVVIYFTSFFFISIVFIF